jgi:RNA polymerase sigma factor (sigma-70 family)
MLARTTPGALPATDAGERAAFEADYHAVSRSAYLLARQLGRPAEVAADVVQEAALRAWRYRSTRNGAFRPWFLTIVYRQARSPLPDWLPLPARWDPPAAPEISSTLDPELISALRELPVRQRAALWLRYCDDMAIADVARIMGCSETAAKQLLLRGRDALRARLQANREEVRS